MKRIVAIVLLAALLLGGCYKDNEAVTPEIPAAETSSPESSFDLKPLISREVYHNMLRDSNSRGAYYYEQQYPNEYTNYNKLTHTDFSSAKTAACCGIEGCAHDTPDCTARHDFYYASRVLPTEKELIWIQEHSIDETRPAKISVSGLDGLNPRELTVFERCAVHFNVGDMLYDDRYLYAFYTRFDESSQSFKYRFLKLDLASGERAIDLPIPAADDGEDYLSVGGNLGGDILVLLYSGEDGSLRSLHSVNPETGEYRHLKDLDGALLKEKFDSFDLNPVENGRFCAVTKDLERFVSVDILTLEEKELFQFGNALKGYDAVSVRELDGHYIVKTTKEERDPRYVYYEFLPETGTLKDLTLCPTKIWGMSGDEYFVCVQSQTIEVPYYYGAEILPHPLEKTVYTTAMISKDDYWSNTPNYREITEE